MGGSIAGRFIGVVLLAATVGLASCQAFLTGPPEQPAAIASGAAPEPGEGDAPAGDEPAGDEPAGDEPAGDEPAGDEPAGDEPAGDEPAGDE